MIRTIINADDFGRESSVNEAIGLCFEKRIITNTTLMVNMPYAMDAVRLAKSNGFEDRVGLHLNLTQGVPLTSSIRNFSSFCDGRGEFNARFHLSTAGRLTIGPREAAALSEEIEAQIRRYLAFGLTEKHLDSHHHSHTDLSVWRLAEPLLKKYGFRSVRISRNLFAEGKCSPVNRVYKHTYNRRLRRTGMLCADYFGSYRDFCAAIDSIEDDCLTEMMLHPMFSPEGDLVDTHTPMDEIVSFTRDRQLMLQTY